MQQKTFEYNIPGRVTGCFQMLSSIRMTTNVRSIRFPRCILNRLNLMMKFFLVFWLVVFLSKSLVMKQDNRLFFH